MNREHILNDLRVILCREVFESDAIEITEDTDRHDIEGWDSFEQINILTLIEDKYNIEFDTSRMKEYDTVASLIDYIVGAIDEDR